MSKFVSFRPIHNKKIKIKGGWLGGVVVNIDGFSISWNNPLIDFVLIIANSGAWKRY